MSRSRLAGRSVTGQQVRICRALRLHISSVMLECNLWKTTSAEAMLRLRDGFTERAQNGQRVGVRSPIGTPHDGGVGDVLAKMGAIMFEFGLHPGLGAVGASLRGVRGTDGHVQCSVGIAKGRGEDISGPQVRARDEARYLHL